MLFAPKYAALTRRYNQRLDTCAHNSVIQRKKQITNHIVRHQLNNTSIIYNPLVVAYYMSTDFGFAGINRQPHYHYYIRPWPNADLRVYEPQHNL